ncbi:MAG TPA: hypothetical protein PLU72_08315 [Candidatus Ozemobacteraceae bacterium]|nr:hypothetical protein [Candidatus Ozemobacteraceae bacterium]
MFERILRYLVIIGLLFLPWRYSLLAELSQLKAGRQQNVDTTATIRHLADGRGEVMKKALELQRQQLKARQRALSFILPPFSQARANLMASFDTVRSQIPGEWEVVPEGKFHSEGMHVVWPFRFKYIGTYANAVKALAAMETAPQLLRLTRTTVTGAGSSVIVEGNVEMVYLDDTASGGVSL